MMKIKSSPLWMRVTKVLILFFVVAMGIGLINCDYTNDGRANTVSLGEP